MNRLSILVVIAIMSIFAPSLCAPHVMAAPRKPSSSGVAKTKPVLLRGRIDELSYLCSSAGLRLSGSSLPATVEKIALGSAAAYSGLQEGDKVVRADTEDDAIILRIVRGGKQYQSKIAVNVYGLRKEFETRKIKFSMGDSPFDKELGSLKDCHVAILLDRCLSMADRNAGCPGDISKWMWCSQQINNLYAATSRVHDSGLDVVFFNDTYQIRRGVTLWDLKQIFDQSKPAGSRKNISQPLNEVLNDYFRKRNETSKPQVILVLTDAIQNVGAPLQEVLIEASNKMTRPREVIVSFLQIGDSILAEELLEDLDRNLVAKGARYHLVNYKPFSEVRTKGLLRELLDATHEATQAAHHKPLH